MVKCKACACAWLLIAGCTVGAPPGFSNGDRWTFPLVGPLEDGLLVTPVSVHGKGPYLFAIDPDANVTEIDMQVVEEAGLRKGVGPHRIDETDTGQIRGYAEMLDLKVANLTIDRRDVMVIPVGMYDTEGRHLSGILGRDVLADSLVFSFDRDQGIATLSTVKAFTPPPGAAAIKYELVSSSAAAVATTAVDRQQAAGRSGADLPDVPPVPRRLATAQIGAARFTMHLDLGARLSQLSEASWGKANLTSMPAEPKLRLVDEAATPRDVTTLGVAAEVTLGPITRSHVVFVPYSDKRFKVERVDGALGLDFFQAYAVYANWDSTTYYMKARGDAAATTTARLGRWGADVPQCPHPGCVTAELAATEAGVTLQVTRDAQAANRPLEVFLGVTPASGKAAAPLVVALPGGADKLTTPVPAEYAGATLAVLDVSPFPRACPGDGGCVQPLGAPMVRSSDPGPQGPSPPKTVVLEKLRRLTGAQAIPPSDDAQKAAAGKPLGVAIVKVCLTPDGKVEGTKLVKSSGVPAYDAQLQRTIQATWTFEPVELEGKPAPVCTQVTFLTH